MPARGDFPPPRPVAQDSSYPLDYVSDLTTLDDPSLAEGTFEDSAHNVANPDEGSRVGNRRGAQRASLGPARLRRRAAIAVACVVVGAGTVAALVTLRTRTASGPRAVGPNAQLLSPAARTVLPPLSGVAVGGGQVQWSALRGHVLVVNFWASWCGPCNAEQPLLNAAARGLTGSGVRFVGVDIEDQQVAAQAFRSSHAVAYPSLFDPADAYTMRLRGQGPTYPPFTLVVNRNGQVAGRVLGSLAVGGGSTELVRLVHLVEGSR